MWVKTDFVYFRKQDNVNNEDINNIYLESEGWTQVGIIITDKGTIIHCTLCH